MDWQDNPQQAQFRTEVAKFIQTRLPDRYRSGDENSDATTGTTGWQADRKSNDASARESAINWADALAERGWIAPHWPKEYGGAGLSVMEQFIYNQEMAKADAPPVGGMGVSLLGPTMIVHGSEEQKTEHLPKILSGEVAWAQGYSEPSSGSDLASLQTRAVRDGDDFMINGQKIWTSGAHQAQWMFGLFRTDPEAPKHRGITYLLLSMQAPGITVRPLQQITDARSFNEVFFEDVRVPAKNVIGEVDRGWYVGATHLDFERSSIGSAIDISNTLDDLREFLIDEEAAGSGRSRIGREPVVRSALAERYVEAETAKLFSYRVISMQNRGGIPNYEASVQKVFTSELKQRIGNTAVKALGLYGQLFDPDGALTPMRSKWVQSYLAAVSETIGAGTSEVQRNVIATRGLGLPRG